MAYDHLQQLEESQVVETIVPPTKSGAAKPARQRNVIYGLP
jgi:hypothetical protein